MNRIPAVLCCLLATAASQSLPDAIVVEIDGPAKLRPRFLTTNLGGMLAAKEAADLWTTLRAPLDQLVAAVADTAPRDLDPLYAALDRYRGRIRLSVDVAAGDRAWLGVSGRLTLSPDGRTDLPALARAVSAMLDATPLPKLDVRTGGRKLRAVLFGEERGMTLPFVEDDRFVVIFGDGLSEAVEAAMARPVGAFDGELAKSPFAARADLAGLVGLVRDHTTWFGTGEEVARAIGLDSLDDATLTIRPSGPRIAVEYSMGFRDGERGFFGSFAPAVAAAPTLLRFVPPSVASWQTSHFDFAQLLDATQRTIDAFGFGTMSVSEDLFGVDAGTFAPYLGTEYLQFGSFLGPPPPPDADDLRRSTDPDTCIVFALKDAAAFRDGWRAVAEHCEIWDDEPTEVGGVDLHFGSCYGFLDTCWAITDEVFVVRLGGSEDDRPWVHDVVKAVVAAREGAASPPFPELERVKRYVPPGHNGSGQVSVLELIRDTRWSIISELLDYEVGYDTDSIVRELLPLLQRFDADRALTLTGHDGKRWRYRVLW